uniref:Uncharacterized protein n=1 Tax=Ditylenchus dipsaci TaxID=166011 RepID=A0A915DHR1_9BILA
MLTMAQILQKWESNKDQSEAQDNGFTDSELLCAARTLSSWKQCVTAGVAGNNEEHECNANKHQQQQEDTHSETASSPIPLSPHQQHDHEAVSSAHAKENCDSKPDFEENEEENIIDPEEYCEDAHQTSSQSPSHTSEQAHLGSNSTPTKLNNTYHNGDRIEETVTNLKKELANNYEIAELPPRTSFIGQAISIRTDQPLIFEGARFSSYAEFYHAFEEWKRIYHHPFRVASSETLKQPDGTVYDIFRYRYIVYHCAHYGNPRMRQHDKVSDNSDFAIYDPFLASKVKSVTDHHHSKQNHLNTHMTEKIYGPCGCGAMMRVNFSYPENALRVTTLKEFHSGHELSADTFARITAKVRRLSPSGSSGEPSPGSAQSLSSSTTTKSLNSPLSGGGARECLQSPSLISPKQPKWETAQCSHPTLQASSPPASTKSMEPRSQHDNAHLHQFKQEQVWNAHSTTPTSNYLASPSLISSMANQLLGMTTAPFSSGPGSAFVSNPQTGTRLAMSLMASLTGDQKPLCPTTPLSSLGSAGKDAGPAAGGVLSNTVLLQSLLQQQMVVSASPAVSSPHASNAQLLPVLQTLLGNQNMLGNINPTLLGLLTPSQQLNSTPVSMSNPSLISPSLQQFPAVAANSNAQQHFSQVQFLQSVVDRVKTAAMAQNGVMEASKTTAPPPTSNNTLSSQQQQPQQKTPVATTHNMERKTSLGVQQNNNSSREAECMALVNIVKEAEFLIQVLREEIFRSKDVATFIRRLREFVGTCSATTTTAE